MRELSRYWEAAGRRIAGAILIAAFLPSPAALAAPMELLVPAYFYPTLGPEWNQLAAAAARVPLTAILNPASGPGTFSDPNYVVVLHDLRNAGGKALGYVDTNYALRDPALVRADIDLYPVFYEVDGIFLDQMANDTLAAHIAYYADLYAYIKAHHPLFRVIGNPGTWTQEAYVSLPTVDGVCTYENSTGYPGYVPDPWVFSYTPDHFAHIPYAVAATGTMRSYVELAAARNAALIFVTDDVLPNPYDRLPVYWEQEIAVVESLRVAATPPAEDLHSSLRLRVSPNPMRNDCEIRWESHRDEAPRIWIADAEGREIRIWRRDELGERRRLFWNGRASDGRSVAAGVYFIVARGREGETARKVIRLR